MKKKVLIIGSARHGKDTVAEIMKDLFDYTFESSSVAAARIFLFEALKGKYGYRTFNQCFEDRVNHRKEWHDLICEFNKDDKARLAKEIMKESDMYVGMRSNAEISECLRQGVFDIIIGVYNPHLPEESKESFDINLWEMADIVIPNAGTIHDLGNKVALLGPLLELSTSAEITIPAELRM
jgi:hypothetical protein